MVGPGMGALVGALPGSDGAPIAGTSEAVLSGAVGAPVAFPGFSLIVGAAIGRVKGGPAVLRGMVGAGGGAEAVGAGAPETLAAAGPELGTVTLGGRESPTVGAGGLGITGAVGGAIGAGATGASLALRVTRTVSFFRGMLDVCLDGMLFCSSLI